MNPAAEWLEDVAAQFCTGLHCSPPTLIRSWNGARFVIARCSHCQQKGACPLCKSAHEDQPCQGAAA